MNTVEIICKKRDGKELTTDEIMYLINGYSRGDIPDYQMSAWAAFVFMMGMSPKETADLTMAMVYSGKQVDLSRIVGVKVDKHSTGGVGDTTTIVLAPLVAAAGVRVAKMSGKGLGHTGGTIDKLEAIPGFSTNLTIEQFNHFVNTSGLAVMGQTDDLTPADKKLYGLRDVTGTVESIPLIASSIMSKKLAAGADKILLDVKIGSGAFMKTEADAYRLAEEMVEIGRRVGKKTVGIISDMSDPLGLAVGNALEIAEAIQVLRGKGPKDLTELCLTLGSHELLLAGKAASLEEARSILGKCIRNGTALQKFKEMIANQAGNVDIVDYPELLPQASQCLPVFSMRAGFVQAMNAEEVGLCAMRLGAGREKKTDSIDPAVGIVLKKKTGDYVTANETLAVLHVNDTQNVEQVKNRLCHAFTIGEKKINPTELIRGVVE